MNKTWNSSTAKEASACQSRLDVIAKAAPVLTSRTLLALISSQFPFSVSSVSSVVNP